MVRCGARPACCTRQPARLYAARPWRGAGAVERVGLENRSTGNRTVGSNPTLSAISAFVSIRRKSPMRISAQESQGLTDVLAVHSVRVHALAIAPLRSQDVGTDVGAIRFPQQRSQLRSMPKRAAGLTYTSLRTRRAGAIPRRAPRGR